MRGATAVWRRRAGWLAAVGLFLVSNAGFFFWYRATGQTRQDALEARRTALAGEVGAADREAERLEAQSRRLARVSAAIEEFYGRRIGTRRATLAPVVEEIHATLKRAGISPADIGYTIRPMPKLPLSEMNATFGFTADYRKFKRLLDSFETGARWIVVRDISISRDSDAPGSVQVRMSVGTFFAEEEGERPDLSASGELRLAAPRSRS